MSSSLTFLSHLKPINSRTLYKKVMSPHFCRVRKISPNLNKLISLEEFEKRISHFVEDITKVDYPEGLRASF